MSFQFLFKNILLEIIVVLYKAPTFRGHDDDDWSTMGGTAHIRREAKANREADKASLAAQKAKKAAEDARYEGFENPSTKRDKKRDEAMERDDAAAARKAENRRLAKLEEEEMANLGKKKTSSSGNKKLTKFEIEQNKAMDAKARLKAKFAAKKEAETYVDVDQIENTNRERAQSAAAEDAKNSGTIDKAVKELTGLDIAKKQQPVSMKAAYKAFEERELPTLKEERPGLKKSQYDELLSKMWKKDPTNPVNVAKEGR